MNNLVVLEAKIVIFVHFNFQYLLKRWLHVFNSDDSGF